MRKCKLTNSEMDSIVAEIRVLRERMRELRPIIGENWGGKTFDRVIGCERHIERLAKELNFRVIKGE